MPDTHTDRNMLLGILALQMDFISRDQMIEAMNAWLLDKTRWLDEILLEQDALRQDTHALLVALVDKHLELHAGDAEKSLASLSSIGLLREDLKSIADPEIAASLNVVCEKRPPLDSQATETFTAGAVTSGGTRFRILRPHAKGGLGEVSVARDNELNREVALKEIQKRHADNQNSRARFVVEAEITGGLEHPGIVPVYGLGSYADGRPFYAMRFIKGDSLKEAIDRYHSALVKGERDPSQESLELRNLLGRFVDVCNAVEYAHSRGVLHRDLKPGNIVLGKYGETMVVDWGLAKAVGRHETHSTTEEKTLQPSSGRSSAPTQFGSAIGTPGYMSPEQAAGRLDELGPASDVYSLGATLYYVLTGQAPLKGDDLGRLLRQAQIGEFPTPCEVKSRVPRPLEAVCLKAMALAPRDRYPSPESLADDVEHWLADEPVSAYSEPVVSRAGRWARRHKVIIAMATVLLLAALVSLSIGTALLTRANRRIHSAQRLAEQNEQTARDNYRMAREAIERWEEVLSRVTEDPRLRGHGLQSLRHDLLESARTYYEVFILKAGDDPLLLADLARARQRLAAIEMELGSPKKAIDLYESAIEAFAELADEPEINADLRIAEIRVNLARAHYSLGQIAQSERASKAAIDTWLELIETDADRKDYRFRLAVAQKNLAMLYDLRMERRAEAERLYDDALSTFRKTAEQGETIDILHEMAATHSNLGNLYSNTGRLAQAEESYRTALQLCERLVRDAKHPRYAEFRFAQGATFNNLGSLISARDRWEEARDAYREAANIWQAMSESYPDVPVYQSELALVFSNTAQLHETVNQNEEAERAYQDAINLRETLTRRFPEGANYHNDASATYMKQAEFLESTQRVPDAVQAYGKAIEFGQRAMELSPESQEFAYNLATKHNNLFELCAKSGRSDEALSHLRSGISLREDLLETFPDNIPFARELAVNYVNLGMFQRDHERLQESIENLNKALQLLDGVLQTSPDDERAQMVRALAHKTIAEVQARNAKSTNPNNVETN